MGYWYLTIAIITEVLATSALKESQGFSRLVPSLVVVVGYGASFYFLSLLIYRVSDLEDELAVFKPRPNNT